jgi:hypothetical protein
MCRRRAFLNDLNFGTRVPGVLRRAADLYQRCVLSCLRARQAFVVPCPRPAPVSPAGNVSHYPVFQSLKSYVDGLALPPRARPNPGLGCITLVINVDSVNVGQCVAPLFPPPLSPLPSFVSSAVVCVSMCDAMQLVGCLPKFLWV